MGEEKWEIIDKDSYSSELQELLESGDWEPFAVSGTRVWLRRKSRTDRTIGMNTYPTTMIWE